MENIKILKVEIAEKQTEEKRLHKVIMVRYSISSVKDMSASLFFRMAIGPSRSKPKTSSS